MAATEEITWPESFPDLGRLDDLLRCGICYDYVRTAMITPCSHNFCSLCIRKYMQYKMSCPACLVETLEIQLRNNRVLDEMVAIMVRLKTPLCEALSNSCQPQKTKSHKAKLPVNSVPDNSVTVAVTPKLVEPSPELPDLFVESPQKVTSKLVNLPASPQKQIRTVADMLMSPRKKTGLMSPVKKSEGSSSNTSFGPAEKTAESSDNVSLLTTKNETEDSSTSTTSLPAKDIESPSTNTTLLSAKKTGSSSTSVPPLPAVNNIFKHTGKVVACPVCSVDIPERNINIHLDACLKKQNTLPTQRTATTSTNSRRQLPKLVYKLLNDRDLKKKLSELKLSTQGDRKTLEKRHQRYVVLYNSECDKEQPCAVSDIIKQLEKEEREEGKASCKTWTALQVDKKTDPKVIENAQKKYLKENKSSFDSLIADLKRRQPQKTKKSGSSTATRALNSASSSSSKCDLSNKCLLTSPGQSDSHKPETFVNSPASPSLLSQSATNNHTSSLSAGKPTSSSSRLSHSMVQRSSTSLLSQLAINNHEPSSSAEEPTSTSPILLHTHSKFRPRSPSLLSQLQQPSSSFVQTTSTHNFKSSLMSPDRSQSPNTTQISPDSPMCPTLPTMKSPILSRKRLFEPYETVKKPESTVIEISDDDSNSTVFSASDLNEIDAIITQHNQSLQESSHCVQDNSAVQSCQESPAASSSMSGPSANVLEHEDSTDSESHFTLPTRSMKKVEAKNTRSRTRKRGVPDQSCEPRRSNRKRSKC